MSAYEYYPEGDSSLLVVYGSTPGPGTSRRIAAAVRLLREQAPEGVVDLIPASVSLLVSYDPLRTSFDALRERLGALLPQAEGQAVETAKRVLLLPVCYGGEYGPDLAAVAAHAGLTERETVALHTSRDYLVYMLGFLPGFCYLGGLDERLHMPRLETPRLRIPAGSVGIGGSQTGVYPLESPGGWQLIGQTPLRFYDPHREKPILCEAGMHIQFYPIGQEEFEEIRRREYGEEGGK
jgi:KipI family sensor histidine kinase inhibitor